MTRLVLLIVMTLCVLGSLTAPAVATDYCPITSVQLGQFCDCVVWNYGPAADTSVSIVVTASGVAPHTCPPTTIAAGTVASCGVAPTTSGYCACKVIGRGTTSRASLVVEASNTDYTPLAVVPCQ